LLHYLQHPQRFQQGLEQCLLLFRPLVDTSSSLMELISYIAGERGQELHLRLWHFDTSSVRFYQPHSLKRFSLILRNHRDVTALAPLCNRDWHGIRCPGLRHHCGMDAVVCNHCTVPAAEVVGKDSMEYVVAVADMLVDNCSTVAVEEYR
uniref:CxC5 domain-containing protein n=1 Tax=Haemonchus placei TaxID=6290 RepID=A0A0N4WGD2_HAEPC